jgi:hypothetical protein
MNTYGQATGPAGSPMTRDMREGGEQRTFRPEEDFIPQVEPQPVQPATTGNYFSPDEARSRFAEHLPIEATPNDTLLPSDDPRVYTYQMPNGNIYYLPAFEEQLAERRSFVEALGQLSVDPPSRTEVESALLAIPQAAYNSVRNMVTGRGTYEDIINTASGMAYGNALPRSRFTDELLDESPAQGPSDYWDVVDEDFVPANEPFDTELENFDNRDPEPVAQPPRNPLTPEQINGPLPEQGWWMPSPVPLREGKKPNTGTSPLYPPRDYTTEYAPPNSIVFRSPVREVVAGLQIPSQGIKGSQLIKILQDNPSVRNSEVSALNLGIVPEARYTREEIQSLVDRRVPQIEAYTDNNFESNQRQKVLDDEVDYVELVIDATPQEGVGFRANSQHYGDNTLAHTRASIKQGENGNYLLVEEMQSDLIQRGWVAPEELKPLTQFALDPDRLGSSNFLHQFDQMAQNADVVIPPTRSILSNIFRNYNEDLISLYERRVLGEISVSKVQEDIEGMLMSRYPELDDQDVESLARYIRREVEDYKTSNESLDSQTLSNPPIRSTQESTRLLVESLISYADRSGVDEIVFPPLERIAAERFRPGTKDYEKALTPGSGFHQTYVTSLKKVLQEFQNEFGRENLPVYRRELNYSSQGSLPSIFFEDARDDWNDIRLQLNRIVQENPNENPDTHLRRLTSRLRAIQTEDDNGMIVSMDDLYTSRYGDDYINAASLQSLYERNAAMMSPQLPTDGIAINIGTLREQYNLSYPRFAEGGLVTQTKQAFGGMV